MRVSGFRLGVWALLAAGFLWFAGSAQAFPLGLSPGDVITTVEWDALQSGGNPGDGGAFTVSTNIFHSQGRATSVELTSSPPALPQSNVTFDFDLNFVSESVLLSFPFVNASSTLRSPGGMIPGADVVIRENGNVILVGNFIGNASVTGFFDVTATGQTIGAVARIAVVGGDPLLVAALGGAGGQANLFMTASLTDFMPPLTNLVSDLQIWNSDFTVSMSGTLIPLSAVPFVPEPSTAFLLGGGLIGLLGISRRVRRRQG